MSHLLSLSLRFSFRFRYNWSIELVERKDRMSELMRARDLHAFTTHSTNPRAVIPIMSFYDLQAELPNGKAYPFTQLRGKVVLIVNVSTVW